MAVTVKQTFPKYSRSESGAAITRTYLVKNDTPMDYAAALTTSGVPQYNELLSGTSLRALDISAEPKDDGHIWNISITYRRPKPGNDLDPILWVTYPHAENEVEGRLPIITATPANEMVVAEKAWGSEDTVETGPTVPVVNSVGDLFDTPPMTMRVGMLFNVRWYATQWNVANEITYANTVNKDGVTIAGRSFPAGTAHLQSLVGGMLIDENGDFIHEIEAQILYRPDGHVAELLDNGFRAKDSGGDVHYVKLSGGSYVPATSASEAVSDPVLLNGSGALLLTTPPLDTATHTPVYNEFNLLRSASWSAIHFPTRNGVKG